MTLAKILNYLSIPICLFFAVMDLSEYYIVGISKDIDGYPFGGEGPVPYFYRTAELYAAVCLTYGVLFSFLAILGILNIWKKWINGHLLFVLVFLLIMIKLYHSFSS
jgi:hypothetical protein